ncbi:signal peptidase II [Planctomicrobium sp. SH668]|uniref:signal peptidase II n=1 Tax=Planctomicrobium sp. SH668 TaxID=3448126 RepID=UPI003F5C2766
MSGATTKDLSFASRIAWLLGLSLVGVGLDQVSKFYAIRYLKPIQDHPPWSYLGDIFRIQYAENHGAFLSLFSNFPDEARFVILTVLNGLVLLGLAAYLLAGRSVNFATFLPLALIVVGGVGNLIDRIRFGYVVDFLNLGIGGVRTGIFNIADMAITGGFILMAIPLIFGERSKVPGKTQQTDPGTTSSQPTTVE